MDDLGLKIIDFSHSQVCVDQDAKNRECLQLQSLLDQCERDGHDGMKSSVMKRTSLT